MAPNKDPRRADLIVPYQAPPTKSNPADMGSSMTSLMPMAAMFSRNKFIGWAAVVFSIQTWLGESEDTRKNSSTPGYLNVGLAVMALLVSYLPLFFPNQGLNQGTATGAPPPAPPA